MEDRDRDKMSRNTSSTPAGDVNRSTSSDLGESKDESDAGFGKNIGRSESWESEPSRKSGDLESDVESEGVSSSSSDVERGSSGSMEH